MIPVLIMSCSRDRDLAIIAARSALAAGAPIVIILDDPKNQCRHRITMPGVEHYRGWAHRNGNLNGQEVIMEILNNMRDLAVRSGTGACLKLDSDTVVLSLDRFANAPHGRNRKGGGGFYGAAYSLDLPSIIKGIAECKSEKIQPPAPEDLTIWSLCGRPIAEESDFALAPCEVWQEYPAMPDAVTCGNPLSDGARRTPSEIKDRMTAVLTKANHAN